MLGIAYAASIGSLATIIGTPPNTLLVGYLSENQDIDIGFGQWMLLGLPLAIVLLVVCWWVLTQWIFPPEMDDIPGGRQLMDDELAKLDAMSSAERRVLAIFVAAAASWISIPLIQDEPFISDAGIAMAVGLLLFIVPAGTKRGVRLLDWHTAEQLPWGVLLLFGGGLALSAQFTDSGLSDWIGEQASGLGGVPLVLLVALVAAGVLLLTELTSNTATAATFLPLAGGVALGLGLDPLLLTIPVALAATCAFMLPVATPPNAIAYGSGLRDDRADDPRRHLAQHRGLDPHDARDHDVGRLGLRHRPVSRSVTTGIDGPTRRPCAGTSVRTAWRGRPEAPTCPAGWRRPAGS